MYEFSNLLSHNIYWETYFDRKMFIVQDFDWVIVFLKNPEKKKKKTIDRNFLEQLWRRSLKQNENNLNDSAVEKKLLHTYKFYAKTVFFWSWFLNMVEYYHKMNAVNAPNV